MVGHGGSSAGSYLADPTSPIPSHCASIVVTSTVRVNILCMRLSQCHHITCWGSCEGYNITFIVLYCNLGSHCLFLYISLLYCIKRRRFSAALYEYSVHEIGDVPSGRSPTTLLASPVLHGTLLHLSYYTISWCQLVFYCIVLYCIVLY